MEPSPSPLTRQTRPDSFQPKIVQLYKDLFNVREHVFPSEGFWQEFFLLPPDKDHLRQVLESLKADDILRIQEQTHIFFARAVAEVRGGTAPPRPQNALEVGLATLNVRSPMTYHHEQNLTAFLGGVLAKKYPNPSSDVIAILAGLDQVDRVVSDLVSGLDDLARNGSSLQLRSTAIDTLLALTAGAYQTGLISYLTHRDLFPTLMKYARDCDDPALCFEPSLLLGLLANYNKFEFQNPYQNRLEDFVHEPTMHSLLYGIARSCAAARDSYLAIHDDVPEGWNLNSALAYVGLGAVAPAVKQKKAPASEENKESFDALPPTAASALLLTYSFVYGNKLFASSLISLPRKNCKESPFAVFLSFASYLSHHAYRSQRCLHYALLSMLTMQTLVEDPVSLKRLSSDELKVAVRLCRQRPPHPPLLTSERIPASTILDICADAISHNLRRRLDIPLYTLAVGIILRIATYLSRNKIRLSHHWAYLWTTLFSLLRFLTQYSIDLVQTLPTLHHDICSPLTDLVAFCLSAGDTFLPDPASYDDLFYKLIETGSELLTKFRNTYYPAKPPVVPITPNKPSQPKPPPPPNASINILISVSTHYHDLLHAQHGRKVHQSPTAVQKVIKQGYETLSIEAREDLGRWEQWREGSWRAELKRMVRTVVEDAKRVAV